MKKLILILFLISTTAFASSAMNFTTLGVGGSFSPTYISAVLTTRVTATPTALGEYRTFTKNGDSTATDNAPTTGPSSSDGMRIFAKDFGTSGTNGQPNKWVIYVGTNKKYVHVEAYTSTGRTGTIDMKYFTADSVRSYGAYQAYDPATGLLVVSMIPNNGSITLSYAGVNSQVDGSASAQPTDCYFDVLVL